MKNKSIRTTSIINFTKGNKMNFFTRMKVLMSGFFTDLVSKQEEVRTKNLVQGTINEYQSKMKKIHHSICNLLFQKKKLEKKLEENRLKVQSLTFNVEELVKKNQDDLALKIIAKLEGINEESSFIEEQIQLLDRDIQEGKNTEKELVSKIGGSGEQLRLLGGRIEALKLRKSLKQDISAMSSEIKDWNSENSIQKLQDQALKLEVEMDLGKERSEVDEAVLNLEKNQKTISHRKYLDNIKSKLKIPDEVYGRVIPNKA
jgi:phage shock protein A